MSIWEVDMSNMNAQIPAVNNILYYIRLGPEEFNTQQRNISVTQNTCPVPI